MNSVFYSYVKTNDPCFVVVVVSIKTTTAITKTTNKWQMNTQSCISRRNKTGTKRIYENNTQIKKQQKHVKIKITGGESPKK